MQGMVRAFFPEKGYGFIDAGEKNWFFHVTDVDGDIPAQGDSVEFTPGEGNKALCVRR